MSGCAGVHPGILAGERPPAYPPGTILSAEKRAPVSFEEMIDDIDDVRVVYVGESHIRAEHHRIQLEILRALYSRRPGLAAGMEMFARTYQPVLDRWWQGELGKTAFIEAVHWYANWKYDYDLYAGLLSYIQENRIPLYGLNMPFHIPPKIAAGGLDSLLPDDRRHLPDRIDRQNTAHRRYVKNIFNEHRRMGKPFRFENFYQAQCAWDEAMAETVSRALQNHPVMVVFAGNGHIIHKFGIPARAHRRTAAAFRSVMPVSDASLEDLEKADYLWITGPDPSPAPIPAKSP